MRLLCTLIVLIVLACGQNRDRRFVQYKDGKQLLTVNTIQGNGDALEKITILKNAPDSVLAGEALKARIFLSNTDQKIADAYVNCPAAKQLMVDTATFEIEGCEEGLVVQDNAIFIDYKTKAPGAYTFPEITILTVDPDKIFRVHKYTFRYSVVKK